ncbi:hypothetical protein Ahy_B09g095624 isoform B [Arachis hypogaea]|uniref:Uncharacterized protein n=1 Tax=Arachis hypogaea TaxID=3818 RepID=A0A444XG47_ARAHY|nr:hypothetical protein Ahy_B09g095619 isoform B [Arachis hypogaea]RYQ88430.1 hypothetical protein Ahy_B09g095624 isoform B [Arachis hypogaea]
MCLKDLPKTLVQRLMIFLTTTRRMR